MYTATSILALALAAVFVIATVLPLSASSSRWIRVFDFPRIQIAVGLTVSGVLLIVASPQESGLTILAVAVVAGCLGYQATHIIRYSPVYPRQAASAVPGTSASDFRMLIANVLMENRDAALLLQRVRDTDPDVAVFVETDDWWDSSLSLLEADYPFSVRRPQDNHYGMVLFSRVPLVDPEIRFLVRDEIPSIRTGVRLKSGDVFTLYALHPVPPPLADTEMRDAEILVVAKEIENSPLPAIVAGDLNDVSWSRTTRMFMRISQLLDPRIGRGFFASYNAKNPLMRWPLDHVFHDTSFTVNEIRLLKSFGSDHFPVFVSLRHQPAVPPAGTPEPADAEDRQEAKETIEAGKNAEPGANEYPNPPNQTGKHKDSGSA